PSFYFGHFALGVVLLGRGEYEDARASLERALAVRPGDARVRLLRVSALVGAKEVQAAEDALVSILRDRPEHVPSMLAASDLLERGGRPEEALTLVLAGLKAAPRSKSLLGRAWRLLGEDGITDETLSRAGRAGTAALILDPGTSVGFLVRARVRRRRGDAAGALRDLEKAIAAGSRRAPLRYERFALAIEAEVYGEALEAWEEALPLAFVLGEGNRRRPAVAALRGALGRADGARSDPRALAALARALSATGFAREAALVGARALALAPESPDLQALTADLDSWARFLDGVRDRFRRGYRSFDAGEEGKGLEGTLDALRSMSRRRLGRDVFEGILVDDYAFVGSVARTDGPGAARDWEDRGALLVLGRRAGGPAEATLLRVVGRYPDAEAHGVPFVLTVGEGRTLRSYGERVGGGVAGFTLPGWVMLNLDVLAGAEEEIERLASSAEDRPLWPARDEERRTSLWFTQGVRGRLARRHLRSTRGSAGVLGSVLAHEAGHVLDADRWVPFGKNLPGLLWHLIRHGFSISSIEVTLEANAEAHALLNAPFPRGALLNTMSYLPYRTSGPPHSLAYHDLLREIVLAIEREPERYPSIDRRYSFLGQLDRLTDSELGTALSDALE
ncbi:MAG: tetratricopeptide repeat protein, partial [Planctomycetota bacterium]